MSKLSQCTGIQTIYQHFRFRCGRTWGVSVEWSTGITVAQALVAASLLPSVL
jgi:hypothetical protein